MRPLISIAGIASLLAFSNAHAQLDGKTINFRQFYHGNDDTEFSRIDENFVVGPAIEFTQEHPFVDISNDSINLYFPNIDSGSWADAKFNGYIFSMPGGFFPAIESIKIQEVLNTLNFDENHIKFDENSIWVDFSNLQVYRGAKINLKIKFYPLPVPNAPGTPYVVAHDGQAEVSWATPINNGSAITKYTVIGVPGGSCTSEVVPHATTPATSCLVTGLTNGTPYKFKVVATNSTGDSDPSLESDEVTPWPALVFAAPASIPLTKIGQSFNLQLTATGGSGGYTYSINSGSLPSGLTLDPNSGMISGTPTTAGPATATILAKDNTTHQQTASVTIVVDPLDLTVPVENQTLPGGQVGQAYSASIVVAGGVAPYTFTLTGDLPDGLTLNPTTGAITGTPTKAQTSTFSVTIEDSTLLPQSAMAKAAVHSVTQSFSITVAAVPVVAAPTPVPTLGEWGVIALSSLLAMFGLARSRRRQG
ncbi:MAG: IPTL-CTERM sorting domain-containing protein [Burkholderiaceae bacterium]|jgi:hypothetical protein|nr:IPTL-CTERM sorting domain-containing protein [Burkholderiaceae bacterium]